MFDTLHEDLLKACGHLDALDALYGGWNMLQLTIERIDPSN